MCSFRRKSFRCESSYAQRDDALNYQALKTALIRMKRFRSLQYDLAVILIVRLEMAKTPKTNDDLYDIMLCDQLIQNLKLLLKERTPKILNNMAELADQYKDARDLTVNHVTQTGKSKTLQKKPNSDVK